MAEAPGSSDDRVEVPPPRWRKTLLWVGCGAFLVVALVAVLFPLFAQGNGGRESRLNTWCMRNLKQLAIAGLIYAMDSDDHLPPADRWATMLEPLHRQSAGFYCPVVGTKSSVNG
jgi:hypothetical protein